MLPSSVRILVCTKRQDMRCSFDRLAEVVRTAMGEEPQSGTLFVFVGKRPSLVKVLWWDRNGYCILYKRLHRDLFAMPSAVDGASSVMIDSDALAQLLAGIEREQKKLRRRLH